MTTYEKFGDTIYPVTRVNGMILIDYPEYNPLTAKVITEEGKKNIENLTSMLKKFINENNVEFTCLKNEQSK